jgi:hypothetical protein
LVTASMTFGLTLVKTFAMNVGMTFDKTFTITIGIKVLNIRNGPISDINQIPKSICPTHIFRDKWILRPFS